MQRVLQQLRYGGTPSDLHLLDWQQSICWAFLGVVSTAICISSTNKRLNAERRRLELQQDRLTLLEKLVRVKTKAWQQQQDIAAAIASLQAGSSNGTTAAPRAPPP